VVLGIVIALRGQLIEHRHDNHKRLMRPEPRIRDEIAMNGALLGSRLALQDCIDRRIDAVSRLLDAADSPNYVLQSWLGRRQIWEICMLAGRLCRNRGERRCCSPKSRQVTVSCTRFPPMLQPMRIASNLPGPACGRQRDRRIRAQG
jgi:hypothetical protein